MSTDDLPKTEYDAATWLHDLRYGGHWACERCGHHRATHLRCRPQVWQCNSCNRSTSVTAGTVLHGTKVDLVKVVLAAALLSSPESLSSYALARELEVTQPTAWYLGQRIRDGFLCEDAPFRKGTTALLSQGSCEHRPPPGKKRSEVPTGALRLHFHILWEQGRAAFAIRAGEPQPAYTLAFAEKLTGEPPQVAPPLHDDPTALLDHTHHGVSARWLPHYLSAIAVWASARARGDDRVRLTLERALRNERRPLSARPPHPPPSPDLREWRRAEPRHRRGPRSARPGAPRTAPEETATVDGGCRP